MRLCSFAPTAPAEKIELSVLQRRGGHDGRIFCLRAGHGESGGPALRESGGPQPRNPAAEFGAVAGRIDVRVACAHGFIHEHAAVQPPARSRSVSSLHAGADEQEIRVQMRTAAQEHARAVGVLPRRSPQARVCPAPQVLPAAAATRRVAPVWTGSCPNARSPSPPARARAWRAPPQCRECRRRAPPRSGSRR